MIGKKPFEQVYEENYDRIYRYAFTLLCNKACAEDVVSDTFLAAFSAYGKFDPNRSSVSTWLSRIAHNKAINLLRSRDYLNIQISEELSEAMPDADIEGQTEAREAKELVLWLYRQLAPEEREFLELRYNFGLKDKDVAAIYSISVKAVNKRYQRLLQKCREIMEGMQ